jgi:predicted GNAT family N-acyltransferase
VSYRIVTTSYQQDQTGIQAVRRRVFIEEQGIDPTEEWDTHDVSAIFSIALDDRDQAIGTARLLKDGKIGRMAVLPEYRRQGVGRAILQHLLAIARQQGYTRIQLSAQQSVIAFYAQQGFVPIGPPHEEVGIPHQNMQLML